MDSGGHPRPLKQAARIPKEKSGPLPPRGIPPILRP
jgi:hypothetical protein